MKINKIFSNITNSKFVGNHLKKVIDDDTFAAKSLVVCAVAKDVFAYSVRYNTTKKNEKIPKEQRNFVAAMDIASGAVTSVLQLGVGFAVANPKLQNKIWNKLFSGASFQNVNAAKKTFISLFTLVTSGILTERVLVPLLATPIAEKLSEKNKAKQNNTKK